MDGYTHYRQRNTTQHMIEYVCLQSKACTDSKIRRSVDLRFLQLGQRQFVLNACGVGRTWPPRAGQGVSLNVRCMVVILARVYVHYVRNMYRGRGA